MSSEKHCRAIADFRTCVHAVHDVSESVSAMSRDKYEDRFYSTMLEKNKFLSIIKSKHPYIRLSLGSAFCINNTIKHNDKREALLKKRKYIQQARVISKCNSNRELSLDLVVHEFTVM